MNEAQAIGDVVGAGLAARVLEPGAGEAADAGHTHESACLNCGTALIGSHCHACGQAAHVHRTLGAFGHDLLHGVFHFEGKIWRTLPMLAWKPGTLTRRYIDGQRASFVSPLALFLFSVFLMFAVYHQTAGEEKFEPDVAVTDGSGKAQGEAAIENKLAALEGERARLQKAGSDTDAIDGQIEGQRAALEVVHEVKATGSSHEQGKVSDIAAIDRAVKTFRQNPGLALYKAQTYAYKYSWVLIPISVPFVWLLFPFSRRFHLYDHTVFVTYSLCFMTLLAVVAMILDAVGLESLAGMLALIPPVHMYRQLRGAYGCSRGGALIRASALAVFAFIALLLFVIVIAAETGA